MRPREQYGTDQIVPWSANIIGGKANVTILILCVLKDWLVVGTEPFSTWY